MEEKFNIAICDDEKSTLDIIENITRTIFLQKNKCAEVDRFLNADELMSSINKKIYDLILLDIDLGGNDGIKVAKIIFDKGIKTKIVFVSSHEERVFESLQTHPYGFVRKNNFFEDFTFVINSFFKDYNLNNDFEDKLIINNKEVKSVEIKNIIYIESEGKYQNIYLDNPNTFFTVRQNMSEFENKLVNKGFIRTHKCYLVNSEYIKIINNDNIVLKNNVSLIISKRKVRDIRNQYLEILKNRKQNIIINKK